MKVTIDRFEGGFAVVLTDRGESFSLPRVLFDGGGEGDVFDISRDDAETKARRAKMKNLIDELWK